MWGLYHHQAGLHGQWPQEGVSVKILHPSLHVVGKPWNGGFNLGSSNGPGFGESLRCFMFFRLNMLSVALCFAFFWYMWVLHQICVFFCCPASCLCHSCVSFYFICSLGLTIGWNQPWWDLLKLHLIWKISGGVGKESKTTTINNCTGVGFHQYTREPLMLPSCSWDPNLD